MAGIRPVEFTKNYYKEMEELDAILYPWYDMKLLEEAAETYTMKEREDHMTFAEFHQEYYDSTRRELNANAYQNFYNANANATLVEKQERLEEQLEMAEGHIISYVATLFD